MEGKDKFPCNEDVLNNFIKRHHLTVASRKWPVEIIDEGRSCQVLVSENQPLLEAFEMAGLKQLYDCRRGNCLSCSTKMFPSSTQNYVTEVETEKGAIVTDTFLCNEAKEQGFLLSCCSYVKGPGLKLELNKSDEAWYVQYVQRLDGDEAKTARLFARAKSMRIYSEKNIHAWIKNLEKSFSKENE